MFEGPASLDVGQNVELSDPEFILRPG